MNCLHLVILTKLVVLLTLGCHLTMILIFLLLNVYSVKQVNMLEHKNVYQSLTIILFFKKNVTDIAWMRS